MGVSKNQIQTNCIAFFSVKFCRLGRGSVLQTLRYYLGVMHEYIVLWIVSPLSIGANLDFVFKKDTTFSYAHVHEVYICVCLYVVYCSRSINEIKL